jgi:hypothetical protein
MLKAYFQKVRDEYSHEAKKRVAFTGAAIITVIVFFIWLSFTVAGFSSSAKQTSAVATEQTSPFAQIKGAWQTAFSGINSNPI